MKIVEIENGPSVQNATSQGKPKHCCTLTVSAQVNYHHLLVEKPDCNTQRY